MFGLLYVYKIDDFSCIYSDLFVIFICIFENEDSSIFFKFDRIQNHGMTDSIELYSCNWGKTGLEKFQCYIKLTWAKTKVVSS